MTLQNPKLKIIIAIVIIIPASVLLVSFSTDSCGIQHISILNDIQKYEESFDPEFCEELVYRIDDYNEICKPEIEILDCG